MLALLVCLWAGPADAQLQVATLHGVLHDGQQSPIANATIKLTDAQDHLVASATTDAAGRFALVGRLQAHTPSRRCPRS